MYNKYFKNNYKPSFVLGQVCGQSANGSGYDITIRKNLYTISNIMPMDDTLQFNAGDSVLLLSLNHNDNDYVIVGFGGWHN